MQRVPFYNVAKSILPSAMRSGVSFSDPGMASGKGEKKRLARRISSSAPSAKTLLVASNSDAITIQ
jgi:hypothetical protein